MSVAFRGIASVLASVGIISALHLLQFGGRTKFGGYADVGRETMVLSRGQSVDATEVLLTLKHSTPRPIAQDVANLPALESEAEESQ